MTQYRRVWQDSNFMLSAASAKDEELSEEDQLRKMMTAIAAKHASAESVHGQEFCTIEDD